MCVSECVDLCLSVHLSVTVFDCMNMCVCMCVTARVGLEDSGLVEQKGGEVRVYLMKFHTSHALCRRGT